MMRRHPMEDAGHDGSSWAGRRAAPLALPSLSAILAACSKPGYRRRRARAPRRREIPIATLEQPGRAAAHAGPDRRRHADRVGAARPLQLGRLHLQAGGRRVRGGVRRRGRDHHLQQHGGRASRRSRAARSRPTCSSRPPGYLRRLVQKDLLQPLQHELIPNMRERVAQSYSDPGPTTTSSGTTRVPYTIYTWGVAYRRDRVSDDDAGRAGLGRPVEPRVRGRDQPLRLVRRHDRDRDPPQRQPRCEHRRPRRSSTRPRRRSCETIEREPGAPHDQRRLREAPGRRLHRRRGLVGRHRRRAVVPAEGHRARTCSATGGPRPGRP